MSPSLPALVLLFGMIFALAAAHFIGVTWTRVMTVLFFLLTTVWIIGLAWRMRASLLILTVVDGLFAAFVTIVVISLAAGGEFNGGVRKFAIYLPFMVIVPYVCGRLMSWLDVKAFIRFISIAGLILLPLLLIDRLVSPGREVGRWAFFGQDHGALMAGQLIAAVLIILCTSVLNAQHLKYLYGGWLKQFAYYFMICLATAFLVWVTARGWLISGLVGVAGICLVARNNPLSERVGLFAVVLTVVGLSFMVLPKLDPYFARLYAVPVGFDGAHTEFALEGKGPILGESSCQPFVEGNNSVAMRELLYREAIAMLLDSPILGVGAARFGERSCSGLLGFPHSTLLQGLAELGVIGGGLLIALVAFAVFPLLRHSLSLSGSDWSAYAFLLALFIAFLMADQIYGNYFMATGMWLLLGMASGMRAKLLA